MSTIFYNSYLYELLHNTYQYFLSFRLLEPNPNQPPNLNQPLNPNPPLTDFYYLSLIQESPTEYTIHGLWPQTSTTKYPTYCRPVNFQIKSLEPILDELEQYWYSRQHTLALDEKFWEHEYEKHGSCVYTPMTELEYFQNTITLYEKALELNLPQKFYNPETKKCLIPVNQKMEFFN